MARTRVNLDDLNRASLGSNWDQMNTWAGGTATIAGSTVLQGAGVGGLTQWSIIRWVGAGSFGDEQYAEAQTTALDWQTTAYGSAAIINMSADVNSSGAEMDFYAAVVFDDAASGANHTTGIYKVVNGTATLQGATVSMTWTVNDLVGIERVGNVLHFCKNGVSQYNRTDSGTPLTGGAPAFALAGGGVATRLDNLDIGNNASSGGSSIAAISNYYRMMRGA